MKTTKEINLKLLLTAAWLITGLMMTTQLSAQRKHKLLKPTFAINNVKVRQPATIMEAAKPAPVPQAERATIEGMWFLAPNQPDDGKTLIYERHDGEQLRWGNYLDIRGENSMIKGYSAPCGNDTQIHSHLGRWKFKGDYLLLIVNGETHRYKADQTTEDKLVLVRQ